MAAQDATVEVSQLGRPAVESVEDVRAEDDGAATRLGLLPKEGEKRGARQDVQRVGGLVKKHQLPLR
jgi:hypothetical protein